MQKLLIATSNPGKFVEISLVLSGLGFKLVSLKDLGLNVTVEEDGDTFKENAYKKARHFYDLTGILTLAEDSGISVAALKGELGVKTRRFGAGENASDEEWLDFFMKRMEGAQNREASFVCSACLLGEAFHKDIEEFFEGETGGRIAEKLLAPISPGIPLSSCFIPEGFDKAYANLDVAEKNKISHRGKAMAKVKEFLENMVRSGSLDFNAQK